MIAAAIAAVAPVMKLRRPVEKMLESGFSFMNLIVETASPNSRNFVCGDFGESKSLLRGWFWREERVTPAKFAALS